MLFLALLVEKRMLLKKMIQKLKSDETDANNSIEDEDENSD